MLLYRGSRKKENELSTQKKSAPRLSAAEKVAVRDMDTTAAKIRFLLAQGYQKADVARILGVKYQWVRNVSLQPLKGGA
jgi:hypothetical protein